MTNNLSKVAGFRVDDNGGTLTDISQWVNNVSDAGGNSLVQDTGLGMERHHEIPDIKPIMVMTINGFLNSTTEPIFAAYAAGWGTAITVEHKISSGKYLTGEAYLGPVNLSTPIGLQTFSAEFRSTTDAGFVYTGTAAT